MQNEEKFEGLTDQEAPYFRRCEVLELSPILRGMAATVIQNQFVEYTFDSTFTTDSTGRFQLTGNVTNIYRQVSVSVATKGPIGVALTMHVAMTSIYGFSDVGTFPNGDGLIHTFPVVGSQFILYATGAFPNVIIPMHGWVFIN